MVKLLTDATLPHLQSYFPPPFALRFYTTLPEVKDETILLCRASLQVNNALPLKDLRYILTASSGLDHLDLDYLEKHHIQVMDAKGANANAVVHYVFSTLRYLKQHAFHPKTIGIIGLGEIGSRLQQQLIQAGYEVVGYDPFKEIPSSPTLLPPVGEGRVDFNSLSQCDCLCIHANLHDTLPYPSRNLLNQDFFKKCSPKMCIINASRGGIVNEADLLAYYRGLYCTDVYVNEPEVNPDIIARAVICTPHIAGHTVQAKAAIMERLSTQLHQALGLPLPAWTPRSSPRGFEYDPSIETRALKANPGDFLRLRRRHERFEEVK